MANIFDQLKVELGLTPKVDVSALVTRALPKPWTVPEVPESEELWRIVNLPRRPQVPPGGLDTPEGRAYCVEFSKLFARFPVGHPGFFLFRPVQAWGLSELSEVKGLFAPIPVGEGKTAISYLAPTLVQASRPLLLIPAALREKTRRDFHELSGKVYGPNPATYRIESYQRLSTMASAKLLHDYAPDLIVADECQHLRNPRAAATRRLRRYMDDNPRAMFVGLSGTITKRSILDYYLLIGWALRHNSPLPRTWVDCAPWANCIDEKPSMGRRILPGALKHLASSPPEYLPLVSAVGEERVRAARAVYRKRFSQTRGVVAIHATNSTALVIRELDPDLYPLDARDGGGDLWRKFRDDWELPDGQMMTDALEVSRHARELALGFYYRWTNQPPDEWRDARKQWSKFVRTTLKHSHHLDTEAQVIHAIKHQSFPNWKEGAATLEVWRAIQPKFVPITEPCWFSQLAAQHCARWLSEHRMGIVWTEHEAFGSFVAKLARVPFYGEQGRDQFGRKIEDHPAGTPFVASMKANGTGRNLQPWCDNLLTAPPFTGAQLEQLLGRTHRQGQRAETVTVELMVNCWEHINTFWKSVADCEYTEGTTGIPQKVSMATIDIPDLDDIEMRHGARWSR